MRFSFFLFLSLLIPVLAFAGPFEDGRAAYARQSYDDAVKSLREAADQGNRDAQIALGPLYANGFGVTEDYVEAAKLYFKAADKGEASGLPGSDAPYVAWYRDAADQGDADAQRGLAIFYANGLGVSIDFEEAYFWLSLSVKIKGSNPDDMSDGNAVTRLDDMGVHLTPEKIANAKKRVKEWVPSPAAAAVPTQKANP